MRDRAQAPDDVIRKIECGRDLDLLNRKLRAV
jgi:hypothetical protein